MKKLFVIIFACFLSVNAIFAQCAGGGTSIFPITTSMNGSKPAAYTCDTFRTVNLVGTTGVPLTTGASACPGGTCTNPGYFAPYYETYQFKNTLLTPQCLKINWSSTAPGGCNITFAYDGTGPILLWTPTGAPCYTVNMGSPGPVCMGAANSYQLEVSACAPFTVFLGNNNGARGTFSLNITTPTNGLAAVGCIGAACKKLLTIGGTPVPTMTQWGLFLFGLILLTLASTALYNYTRRVTVTK
jgi:hypothetical protein